MARTLIGTNGLSDRQRLFVTEYLKDLNAFQAAVRAGYSPKSAGTQGTNLLKNPAVLQAIHRAMKDRERRCGVTQDQVIYGLLEEAGYYGPNSMHSARVSAWKALGLHLGMFTMKHAHGGDADAPPIQHQHSHQPIRAADLDMDQETAEKLLKALREAKEKKRQQNQIIRVEVKDALQGQLPAGDRSGGLQGTPASDGA